MEKNLTDDRFEVTLGNCGVSAEAVEMKNRNESLARDVVEAVRVALGMREGGQDSRFIDNDPKEVMCFANHILTTFEMSDLTMWERAEKYTERVKKYVGDMGLDVSDAQVELYRQAYLNGELAQNEVDMAAYMKGRVSVEFKDRPAIYYVCVRGEGTMNVFPCTVEDYTPTNTNKPAVKLSWRYVGGEKGDYVIYGSLPEVVAETPKAYSNGLITFCRNKEQCRKVLKAYNDDKATELRNEIERLNVEVKANETLLEDYDNRDAYWIELKLNEHLDD